MRVLRRERERGVCVGCDDSVFIIHILEAITPLSYHLSVNSFFVFTRTLFFQRGTPLPCVCKKKLFVTVTAFVDTIITNTNGSTTTTTPIIVLFHSRVINKNTHGTGDIG